MMKQNNFLFNSTYSAGGSGASHKTVRKIEYKFFHWNPNKMFNNIFIVITSYLRPLIKWFLRKFTRLCELQRICYGEKSGAPRTKAVEHSLQLSRSENIKTLIKSFDTLINETLTNPSVAHVEREISIGCITTIQSVKKINPKIHPDFAKLLSQCTKRIWGYRRLYGIVETMRKIPYDCDNLEHEQKLFELWKLLMPQQRLECRITKQWQDIGFQGDDPKTDFRGMGILGLENLLYFAREYNGAALHVLSHSHHPTYGYTFAIVGINLTSTTYNLLKSGAAKTHFYNLPTIFPTITAFHKLYCYLFYEFDKYWMKCKPISIMDFSYIHDQFEKDLLSKLSDNKTLFKLNLFIENI